MDEDKIRQSVILFLEGIGEDPKRPGLRHTADRVVRMCREIYSSVGQQVEEHLRVLHGERHDEIVLVKDIPFYSMCEHHLLPFIGKAHVAYIPNEKIVGLSKIARVVEAYARRLQVQERMTAQIASCLMRNLDALGVGVILHAQHLCMMMRGIQKQNSYAVTSEMLGAFERNPKTRAEFLTLIGEKI